MAENTDTKEENPEDQINFNPDNTSEEFIPEPELSITPDPQSQTEQNMETHAHELYKAPGQGWKHYFFEFFMLFLAVFCGFLAENLREDYAERHRGKEIIVSLIEDLKKDTALLNIQLIARKQNKIALDSLVILLTAPDIKERGAEIYYYGRRPIRFTFFKYTDRTIQQLKNAGSFRLIKDSKVSDSILKYYSLWDGVIFLQNQAQERVSEYIVSSRPVFNPLVFETMVNDQTENKIIKPEGNPPLLTYEKKNILDLISIMHNLKSSNRIMQTNYMNLKTEATELIGFLKREYHLN